MSIIVTDEGADAKRSLGRLATDLCLLCGEKLIVDQFSEFNKYHCCSSCTDFIERERHKVLKAVDNYWAGLAWRGHLGHG